MTLDIGARLPLAGLICLSGYLHPSVVPLLGQATPPVLMIHGQHDPVVPLYAAQNAHRSLVETGVSIQYHELPMAHEISPPAMDLIQDFTATLTK